MFLLIAVVIYFVNRKLCAEARLLVANYNNDICSVDVETNLQQYKDAVETFKEWEKNLVSTSSSGCPIIDTFLKHLFLLFLK